MERDARISPNGRWLAFVSDESGLTVVSVRSVSAPLRRYVVSTSGGDQPVWRRDGKELFYVNAQRFLQRRTGPRNRGWRPCLRRAPARAHPALRRASLGHRL